MQFFVVYIREAHAIDGLLPKGGGNDPIVEDPTTLPERREVARVCMSRLALEPIPALVDTLDDTASRAYDAWPDRLYLVGRDGRVSYRGGPGPDGFSPDELERAILDELAREDAPRVAAPAPVEAEIEAADEGEGESGNEVVTEPGVGSANDVEAGARAGADSRDEPSSTAETAPAAGGATYRCGDLLLDEADADDYHSRLLRWWRIPQGPYLAFSTCSRRTTEEALAWMRVAHDDLVRLFGVEPEPPLTVILLRNLEQYNAFAVTEPDGEHVPPESIGYSAFHHAFPCEQWIDVRAGRRYPGAACAYWDDRTPTGRSWGPLAVRHAAAHAFIERIDPSPRAVATLLASGDFDSEAYWAEKKIPLWLRYGAAMYCERFFVQPRVEDPLWARKWSVDEIARLGGLEDPTTIFRCELSQDDVARSQRLILQAGLVVAFVLDGGVPSITARHEALKRALASGAGVTEAIDALEAELFACEHELRRFARVE